MEERRTPKKMYDELSSDEGSDTDEMEEYGIWEMELETNETKTKKQKFCEQDAKCEGIDCLLSVVGHLAVYLCTVCDMYLCDGCFRGHDSNHEFVKDDSETSEKERMAETLLEGMRREKITDSEFFEEKIRVYGRVYVKHELDKKDCWITGLCALRDKRWVGLDTFNNCMKIFSTVTGTLLRYVRFGSSPRDASEIIIKQKSLDQYSGSGSKSDTSESTQNEPDKYWLLAVTFPWIKQIWLIDLNKCPPKKTKKIQIDTECRAIEFSEDKIFILSRDEVDYESHDSILILSTDGDQLKVIKNKPHRFIQYIPDLTIHKDKIYLTDWDHHKVLCINVEDGKTLSHLTIEGSRPRGISLDSSNNVYVCGWRHNKVYKLSPDLRCYEPLNLDTDFTREPYRMCFAHDKLFVALDWSSPFRNFVTVVGIT